jgi:primase-polymerase (primpol)-like protein
MMDATTTAAFPVLAENIPEELKRRPQWICWRLEERAEKSTKVPYVAGTERRASSTDLMSWRTFEEALAAYERGEPPYDGIGYVFCSGDPYVGIDLDDCRDPETGEISPWASKIVSSVREGYVEASPSGRGIHVITEGVVRGGGMRRGKIEMYARDRYFTITGRSL